MKISIPKPCHEDWNKMQPNEQGAFCQSCCKTVIDFTNKTTGQIHEFFGRLAGQKVCGRFRKEQLQPVPVPAARKTRLSRFLCALYLVFGAFLFTSCSDMPGDVVGKIAPVNDTPHVVGDTVGVPQKDTTTSVMPKADSGIGSTRNCDIIMGGPMSSE